MGQSGNRNGIDPEACPDLLLRLLYCPRVRHSFLQREYPGKRKDGKIDPS